MPSNTKNAIEKRLAYLTDCWNEFAQDSDARLLRWVTDDDGARMIEVFFESQQEDVSELPDLFVRLVAPFDSPGSYGTALAEDLQSQYEESRDALAEEGMDGNWAPPHPSQSASDLDAFLDCAMSFRRHYEQGMALLVFIVSPASIADPEAWNDWLHALVTRLPETIRLTCVDRIESPLLERLAESSSNRVVTIAPELDMPGAMTQLAEGSKPSGPGADFRGIFMQMAQLLPGGNMKEILPKADAALRIVRHEGWAGLEVAIHSMVAAAYLQGGSTSEAVSCYRAAGTAAEAARAKSDPAGAKLLLQSRLGEAAALIQSGSYSEAAQLYREAIPLAEETREPLMKLESLRMAGYCHVQNSEHEMAWNCLWRALDAAEEVERDVRPQSTLPYVGNELLRLAEGPGNDGQRNAIHARMTALMGEGWEEASQQGAARS